MTQKALRFALEALEKIASSDYRGNRSNESVIAFKTLTAIKEVLAQPEYQSTADKTKLEKVPAKGTLLAQPEQTNIERHEANVQKFLGAPQRTWQGLTDEEVDECYYWKDRQWTTDELVRHVEAKLKQKNGYAEEKNT